MARVHILPHRMGAGKKIGRSQIVRADRRTADGVQSAAIERAAAVRSTGTLSVYAGMITITPPAAEKWAAIWSRRDHTGAAGGRRGTIKSFSAASRRRFLEAIMKWRDVPTHFLTLTYPDTPHAPVKRDLAVFKKRLARALPSVSGFWRAEWKVRQSGAMRGVFMPHLHLMLHVPSGLNAARTLVRIRRAWLEILDHKQYAPEYRRAMRTHGFHAAALNSANGAMFYASKYASKPDDTPALEPGRAWGKVGSPNLARLAFVHIAQNAWHAIARAAAAVLVKRAKPDTALAVRLARKEYLYTKSNVWAYGAKALINALRQTLRGHDLSLLDIGAAIRAFA